MSLNLPLSSFVLKLPDGFDFHGTDIKPGPMLHSPPQGPPQHSQHKLPHWLVLAFVVSISELIHEIGQELRHWYADCFLKEKIISFFLYTLIT